MIRKKRDIRTEEFRHFMDYDYGPTYVGLPETRSYVQYYLDDLATDGAEDPIDAVVKISFDSPEAMSAAVQADSVTAAAQLRTRYMRETSVGIHVSIVSKMVTLV